nr:MAG TPA: hypothetical protein [Caudoviricetes sp.]
MGIGRVRTPPNKARLALRKDEGIRWYSSVGERLLTGRRISVRVRLPVSMAVWPHSSSLWLCHAYHWLWCVKSGEIVLLLGIPLLR